MIEIYANVGVESLFLFQLNICIRLWCTKIANDIENSSSYFEITFGYNCKLICLIRNSGTTVIFFFYILRIVLEICLAPLL